MYNKWVITLVSLVLHIGCGQKQDNDKNGSDIEGSFTSVTYPISADYIAEVMLNDSTGQITAFINDVECTTIFNSPNNDEMEVYKMSIEVADYNFDGYKDFAIVGGYRNIQYHINLFNSQTERYIPSETLSNVQVDTDSKLLMSYTTMSAVEHETNIYTANGLTFELHKKINTSDYTLFDINNGEIGTLELVETVTSYLANKDTVSYSLRSSNGDVATYTIKGKRAYLYNSPSVNGKTSMYLVKGDRVELLDIADGFFKIKFINPKFGAIIKWIRYKGGKEL